MTTIASQNSAEEIIRGQLDAYNARDIEAFMAFWAEDAQVFEFPSKLLASGTAEIRARHLIRFQEPDLYARLITRMSVGDTVVDQEIVTRNFPEGPGTIEVIAIHEIEAGKIARAWFKTGKPVLASE